MMIEGMQISVHFPLMEISPPANLEILSGIMISIATFDFPFPGTGDYLNSFWDYDEEEDFSNYPFYEIVDIESRHF